MMMEKTLDEMLHELYGHTEIRETAHSIRVTEDAELHVLIHYGESHAVLRLKFMPLAGNPSLVMFPDAIECLQTMMPDDDRRHRINCAASSIRSFMESWQRNGYRIMLHPDDAAKAVTACLQKMRALSKKLATADPSDDDALLEICEKIGQETAMFHLLKEMESRKIQKR